MQITLLSGDTVSDVLNQFEVNFSSIFNWVVTKKESGCSMTAISDALAKTRYIDDLKRMTNFLATKFSVRDLDAPKRNSKVSLAGWIAEVLLGAREVANTSELTKQVTDGDPTQTDLPSGLIISFGKTLEFLPHKSVTRRTWKDTHAKKFINAFSQNKLIKAFDKDPRYGGKQIGWCRLSCVPYKERLCDMPSEDLQAEGGMCDTIGAFIQQYFDGDPRLEVWVIRFEFIAGLVLATETNPVVATDQVADSSSPEIEVLESEEKPVYTISIIADGSFSEERVSALPPYLIDRKGNLLKKFWHQNCDAGYAEIISEQLSNIAVDSGLVIKLMAEDLEVSQACICGDPPPFIVDKAGGVYKRDRLNLSLSVRYTQVISEYLSNIVVNAFAKTAVSLAVDTNTQVK